MTRPTIDEFYMKMALGAAAMAGCPSRRVGAVITDANDRVLSIGWNEPPRDLPSCLDVYCGKGVNEAPCISAHAEVDAITHCRDLHDARTIYISCSPCLDCAKALMSTNITRIVFGELHKTWPVAKQVWTGKITYMEGYDEASYTY